MTNATTQNSVLQRDEAINQEEGTNRYLDLSTGHVSEQTMDWLNEATPSQSHCSGITVAPYEYGAFLSVPSEAAAIDDLECADDLKTVLKYARSIGCDVVRFDSDAMLVAGLQYFDR
jgi:hypothetical protein